MIRTTLLRNLQIKAASSTPVEPFTNANEEIHMNICIAGKDDHDAKCGTALAKSPGGTVVEISYTNACPTAPKSSSFFYRLG